MTINKLKKVNYVNNGNSTHFKEYVNEALNIIKHYDIIYTKLSDEELDLDDKIEAIDDFLVDLAKNTVTDFKSKALLNFIDLPDTVIVRSMSSAEAFESFYRDIEFYGQIWELPEPKILKSKLEGLQRALAYCCYCVYKVVDAKEFKEDKDVYNIYPEVEHCAKMNDMEVKEFFDNILELNCKYKTILNLDDNDEISPEVLNMLEEKFTGKYELLEALMSYKESITFPEILKLIETPDDMIEEVTGNILDSIEIQDGFTSSELDLF